MSATWWYSFRIVSATQPFEDYLPTPEERRSEETFDSSKLVARKV